jgi:hypothetical protein
MTLRGFTSRSIWTDRIAAERNLAAQAPHVPGELSTDCNDRPAPPADPAGQGHLGE